MITVKKILAVCGSTKAASTNLALINALAALTKDSFEINAFDSIAALPHFNPDLDTNTVPPSVAAFRRALRAADAVLICTPEYAMGVPGSLKNAIDWTVSSCEFSQKPVALITASSQGEHAHASLLATLEIIEAKITPDTQLLISFAKTKISPENKITDTATEAAVLKLLNAFKKLIP